MRRERQRELLAAGELDRLTIADFVL